MSCPSGRDSLLPVLAGRSVACRVGSSPCDVRAVHRTSGLGSRAIALWCGAGHGSAYLRGSCPLVPIVPKTVRADISRDLRSPVRVTPAVQKTAGVFLPVLQDCAQNSPRCRGQRRKVTGRTIRLAHAFVYRRNPAPGPCCTAHRQDPWPRAIRDRTWSATLPHRPGDPGPSNAPPCATPIAAITETFRRERRCRDACRTLQHPFGLRPLTLLLSTRVLMRVARLRDTDDRVAVFHRRY